MRKKGGPRLGNPPLIFLLEADEMRPPQSTPFDEGSS